MHLPDPLKRRALASRMALASALGLALLLAALPAAASWPTDNTTNLPVATEAGNEDMVRSVSDGAGGALVTWVWHGPTGYDYLLAKHLDAYGNTVWSTRLNAYENEILYVSVAADGAGGLVAAWVSRYASTYYVMAQRIAANGDPAYRWTTSGALLRTDTARWMFKSPAVAPDGEGGCFVAWEEYQSGDQDIYGTRVRPDGSVVDIWHVCEEAGDQTNPVMAASPGRSALVVWEDGRFGASHKELYAQLMTDMGVCDGHACSWHWGYGGIRLVGTLADRLDPQVVYDDVHGSAFYLAWDEAPVHGQARDIYAARLEMSTATLSAVGRAHAGAGNRNKPRVATDAWGGALVAWTDYTDPAGARTYVQRMTPAMARSWTDDGVRVSPASTGEVTLARDPAGGSALVGWTDWRSSRMDVFAQRLGPGGEELWEAAGVRVCRVTGGSDPMPVIVSGAGGNAILAWVDGRSGQNDVYAQNVNTCGRLGDPMPGCVNTVSPVAPATCISVAHPCVPVPFVIARTQFAPLRAFSVTLHLTGNLVPCGLQFEEGPYMAAGGSGTIFLPKSLGGGVYQVDCAILGSPCGATAPAGTLFTLDLGSTGGLGAGTVVVDSVVLRDCNNAVVLAGWGPPVNAMVDNVPPDAITTLAATQRKSGNDADGTTKVDLAWSAAESGCNVEIYRAGFGAYPLYDGGGGGIPAAPSTYPPPAPWALAGTVVSPVAAFTDETPARDFYYYVAYVVDGCANASPVSNRTGGTLNYFLGDFSDGSTPGHGNNQVSTEDLSALGMHYGATLAPADPWNYLDVGPTTDYSVDARPATDAKVNLEDLVVFAMNYGHASKPLPSGPAAAARDALRLEASPQDALTARLVFEGTGRLQALSLKLRWDPKVVEPASFAPGELLDAQGGVAFSPEPGALDVARLGAGRGLAGKGTLATYAFRRVGPGDPGIALASATARDTRNRDVDLGGVSGAPVAAGLRPVAPNPFHSTATLEFALPARGTASLSIYSVDGRRVRVVTDGAFDAGTHRVTWDGRDAGGARVAPGVYFARLVTPAGAFSRTVTFLP